MLAPIGTCLNAGFGAAKDLTDIMGVALSQECWRRRVLRVTSRGRSLRRCGLGGITNTFATSPGSAAPSARPTPPREHDFDWETMPVEPRIRIAARAVGETDHTADNARAMPTAELLCRQTGRGAAAWWGEKLDSTKLS